MSTVGKQVIPQDEPASPPAPPRANLSALRTVALCLVIAAAAWFLLRELALLLQPLCLAVFLAYVLVPIRVHFRQRTKGMASLIAVVVVTLLFLSMVAWLIYGSIAELNNDLPVLLQRAQVLSQEASRSIEEHFPWLAKPAMETAKAEEQAAAWLRQAMGGLVSLTASLVVGGLQVAFYLVFLLLEVDRFPGRVRSAFADERAERILAVAGRINLAMASYLKVKVKASLMLAVPVTLVLWAFGIKFALLWGVLTFLANFVPYLGSVVGCGLPSLFILLQLDFGWRPLTVVALLAAIHMLSAYLVEPSMTGKAVNLSPLVILAALSFWGLCWGLTGMVLAVPLTVMLKIILENTAFTRPVAKLLAEE